jgi:hypothetical protein
MKKIKILVIVLFFSVPLFAQNKGAVTVIKDPLIDSLIAKRIELNKSKPTTTNPVSKAIVSDIGYRVQVFYGSDRKQAFSEQSKFKTLYPKLRTYITYKEPNYYLRVGDFRTRMEAMKLQTELKANFPTLFIFREKINAPELDDK